MRNAVQPTTTCAQLDAARRRRCASRPRHLLRVDEPRQPKTHAGPSELHQRSTRPTGLLAGLERSVWRSDFLRGLRFSHHFDHAPALGFAFPHQYPRFLFAALCPPCTIICPTDYGAHLPTFGAHKTFRAHARDRRPWPSAPRRVHLPSQCPGGSPRIPPRQLGHLVVPLCRRDVLPLLPSDLPSVWSRETAHCS